jgi:DNA polymerase I-like protein with 3'-5' exonuclease and polymerase domains
VKQLLTAAGFKRLPFKQGKESSDIASLMNLRLKRPDVKLLDSLIEVSAVNKEISSYLTHEVTPDGRTPFTLYSPGTETHRDSCSKDPWGRGLNAQTLPKHLKGMFKAPEGHVFVEIDLAQADARVVAWDAAEPTLIEFFNSRRDIHRYVASQPELFGGSPDAISDDRRQLGKKVGHAANYGVSAPTLVKSCLKEMNLVISEQRAQQMLSGYYRTFPGIPRWHERIKAELSRTRAITAPTGYTRHFMGRFDSSMWREAYAHLPQHLVAYAINSLIMRLRGHVELRVQIHDSVLFTVSDSRLDAALALVKDQDSWNPRYRLSGGELRIPIEVKRGRSWGAMEKICAG